jgi:hypothetical protein
MHMKFSYSLSDRGIVSLFIQNVTGWLIAGPKHRKAHEINLIMAGAHHISSDFPCTVKNSSKTLRYKTMRNFYEVINVTGNYYVNLRDDDIQ